MRIKWYIAIFIIIIGIFTFFISTHKEYKKRDYLIKILNIIEPIKKEVTVYINGKKVKDSEKVLLLLKNIHPWLSRRGDRSLSNACNTIMKIKSPIIESKLCIIKDKYAKYHTLVRLDKLYIKNQKEIKLYQFVGYITTDYFDKYMK